MEGRQEPKSRYQIYNLDPLKYVIHGHNPRLQWLSRISRLSGVSRLSRISILSRMSRLSRLPILNIVRLLMSLFIAVQLLWFETNPRLPRLSMLNVARFKYR